MGNNSLLMGVLLLFTAGTLSAQSDSEAYKKFVEVLDKHSMEFSWPSGFEEVAVIENPDMGYLFAVKNEEIGVELRYQVFSLKQMVADYKESLKDKTRTMVKPNLMYKSMVLASGLNISGANMADGLPEYSEFPLKAVKHEFFADGGGTVYVEAGNVYGEGYSHCLLVVVHKDDIADAYITFMFEEVPSPEDFDKVEHAFHSLMFKE